MSGHMLAALFVSHCINSVVVSELIGPSSKTTALGSGVSLGCNFTPTRRASFNWYEVVGSTTVHIFSGEIPRQSLPKYDNFNVVELILEGSLMHISSIALEDEGVYRCRGPGSDTPPDAIVTVEVQSALSMNVTSPMVAGTSYEATCEAVGGRPQEGIEWYLNDVRQTRGVSETYPRHLDEKLSNTRSSFTFTPTVENNGHPIYCATKGHTVTGLNQQLAPVVLNVKYSTPRQERTGKTTTPSEDSTPSHETTTGRSTTPSEDRTPRQETPTGRAMITSSEGDIKCTFLSSAAAVGIGVLTFLLALSITLNLIQFIMRRRCPQGIKDKETNRFNMTDHAVKVVTEYEAYESIGMENKAYQSLTVINKDLNSLDIAGDSLSFFTRLDSVGPGGFGDVWKGEIRSKNGANVVALRQLPESFTRPTSFIDIMRGFHNLPNHQNVVKCLGYCPSHEAIIWEFVGEGTLLTYLQLSGPQYQPTCVNVKPTKPRVDESKLLKFGWQIAKGMGFLASKKIVHGDLCAHNVLLTDDRRCKISDYGKASLKSATNTGTPSRWTAPEAMLNGACSVGGDIWSLGIVFWEIITLGAMPYPNMTLDVVKHEVGDGYRMPRPKHCGKDLYAIMEGCWEIDPIKRLHFDDVLRSLERIMEGSHEYLSLNNLDEGLYASP